MLEPSSLEASLLFVVRYRGSETDASLAVCRWLLEVVNEKLVSLVDNQDSVLI